jgi:hypothetical protein
LNLLELKQQAGIQDNPDQEGLDLFAELIVRDLIDSMIKRYGDDDELPIQEIKLFVKEHFGVEE